MATCKKTRHSFAGPTDLVRRRAEFTRAAYRLPSGSHQADSEALDVNLWVAVRHTIHYKRKTKPRLYVASRPVKTGFLWCTPRDLNPEPID